MNDTETTADIRKDAETKFRELVEAYIQRLSSFQTTMGAMQAFNNVFDRLDAAHKREIDELKKQVANLQQQLPKPDPNWRDICAKCFKNGATEPPDCEYYTEDGCMSPIPDQHPLIQVGDCAKLRDALVKARRFIDSSPLMSIRDNTGTIARGELCAEIDAAIAATATAEKPSAVGDVAKLREALETLRELLGDLLRLGDAKYHNDFSNFCDIIDAALAAPPRNCDVIGNTGRALVVHGFPTKSNQWGDGEWLEFVDWLFAPATEKEGGAK